MSCAAKAAIVARDETSMGDRAAAQSRPYLCPCLRAARALRHGAACAWRSCVHRAGAGVPVFQASWPCGRAGCERGWSGIWPRSACRHAFRIFRQAFTADAIIDAMMQDKKGEPWQPDIYSRARDRPELHRQGCAGRRGPRFPARRADGLRGPRWKASSPSIPFWRR